MWLAPKNKVYVVHSRTRMEVKPFIIPCTVSDQGDIV